MDEIRHFVPGDGEGGEAILARLRQPVPAGVAAAYVAAYTEPGERVLVPFCQGPEVVRAIAAAGRQAVAIHFDPVLAVLAQVTLAPPPPRELNAAVARLGDSPKQGMPLRRYLSDLYTTTCPACLRPAVADYFVWDREGEEPVAKQVRCPACAWDGHTGIDAEDHERLAEVEPRGLHYHYVLDRALPATAARTLRPRLERLLALYSPRNLYALAELNIKIEAAFDEGPLRRALKLLLLDCLERCSGLAPLPGRAPPRRLGHPARYLERNVWLAFEEAVGRLAALAREPLPGLVDTWEGLRDAETPPAGLVGQGLVRDLPRRLPPRSLGLILSAPPRLDPAAWALSYLWGAWALGPEAVAPLRPLLRQRTADAAWYARVVAGSLETLSDLLRDEGRLAWVLEGQGPAVVEALALAAGTARMGVSTLVTCGGDHRLELTPAFEPPAPAEDEPLESGVRRAAVAAAVEAIRARGEPVPWSTLHAAIWRRLAGDGLLARATEESGGGPSPLDLLAAGVRAGLEGASPGDVSQEDVAAGDGMPGDGGLVLLPAAEGGELLWWLAAPANGLEPPLADRVEAEVHQLLQEVVAIGEADLAARLYARFPGALTPDAGLVAACLRAYGEAVSPGHWRLRAEDVPEQRQAEQAQIVEQVLALGRRLGYATRPLPPFDAAWFEGDRARAVFNVQWQAAVAQFLALGRPAGEARPYLVIPGGRAELVNYKLAHNPLWARAVEVAGWRFIKYRHVRQLAAQPEVDEYVLRTVVGLDPIAEREGAQIPLF